MNHEEAAYIGAAGSAIMFILGPIILGILVSIQTTLGKAIMRAEHSALEARLDELISRVDRLPNRDDFQEQQHQVVLNTGRLVALETVVSRLDKIADRCLAHLNKPTP